MNYLFGHHKILLIVSTREVNKYTSLDPTCCPQLWYVNRNIRGKQERIKKVLSLIIYLLFMNRINSSIIEERKA